ncbi:hypothetical protein AB1Y20_004305 [Prymnesium parvum]|uniref:Protein kinase domain-containing protein n=1 Tax=Prymnesium parvum TaxID=97485 RepID=A0AB34IWJ6_PRYPA
MLRRVAGRAASRAGRSRPPNTGPLPSDCRFGGYQLGARIGRGGFGDVFAGEELSTGRQVAIKLQRADQRTARIPVETEFLASTAGAAGFPALLWSGEAHGHHALVMARLGPSLKDMQQAQGQLRAEALRTVSEHVLSRLRTMHELHWLHMDVKPANILLPAPPPHGAEDWLRGQPEGFAMHLIDFGLSRKWWDSSSETYLPHTPRRGCIGTVRFASIANQCARPIGRRDDLESLAYTLIFLRSGALPWSGVKAASKAERFQRMLDIKLRLSVEDVCTGFPTLAPFLHEVRAMHWDDRPDYDMLRKLLRRLG